MEKVNTEYRKDLHSDARSQLVKLMTDLAKRNS